MTVEERRMEFSKILRETVLRSPHVYFRKPSKGMKYPCILYERNGKYKDYADNHSYISRDRYTVTVIDPNPDSDIPDRLEETFTYCSFNRDYRADNLNHFVRSIIF